MTTWTGASRTLADALAAARLSDLIPERIQAALAVLRDAGKSNQTVNHYRAALRAFVRWAGDKGRIRDNPMRGVSGFNVEEDIRHVRRCLTDDELSRLIQTAENGPGSWGMPGPLRAMAYRTAAATGFRAAELRSLTPESFRLDGPEPSVFLRASATKNRRPAEQPVPLALARDLADWLRDKPPGASVFPLHHETAKAIRARPGPPPASPTRRMRGWPTSIRSAPISSRPWSGPARRSRKFKPWPGTPSPRRP